MRTAIRFPIRRVLAGLAAAALAGCATPRAAPPTDAAPRCGAQHYPHYALENEQKGDVVVRVEVDAAGRVAGASLQAPSGSRYLDAAALAGVRSCRFAAGGAPRRIDLLLAYRFLSESEIPPQGVVTVGVLSPPQAVAPASAPGPR